jgi:hypothetical protein
MPLGDGAAEQIGFGFEVVIAVAPTQPDDDEPAPPVRRVITRDQIDQRGLNLDPDLDQWMVKASKLQPKTFAECERQTFADPSPCPFVSCKFHLYSDALKVDEHGRPVLPKRMLDFERMVESVPPSRWGETCSLRIANRVIVEKTESGKPASHSIDGHPIAKVGPSFDHESREWVDCESHLQKPTVLEPAVIGRFLGVSREKARQYWLGARAVLRENRFILQQALDRDIDVDAWLDGDDEWNESDSEPGVVPPDPDVGA